jgi:hypothetical protein
VPRDDVFDMPDDRRFDKNSSAASGDRESWLESEFDSNQEESISRHWVWLFVFGIAWLLFELSVDPALSVMVASMGLGWNHFRSWLWRRDPRRGRGVLSGGRILANHRGDVRADRRRDDHLSDP